MLFFLIMMNYKVKKSRRPLWDGSSRQAGQSERVDVTRSRNSCQVAGWSKQGHRNSPPAFPANGCLALFIPGERWLRRGKTLPMQFNPIVTMTTILRRWGTANSAPARTMFACYCKDARIPLTWPHSPDIGCKDTTKCDISSHFPSQL